VEEKLAQMLAHNPLRMNYEKKYQEIIAAYNQDKDRATVEDTFARLIELANSLSIEQRRAVEEGLSEEQLSLFDLLARDDLTKADRERIKAASQALLDGVLKVIAPLDRWTEKEETQADVKTFILDSVFTQLPDPPYTETEKLQVANDVYRHIWQQSVSNQLQSSGLQ
jgi:type I restriction enzyme R subunit